MSITISPLTKEQVPELCELFYDEGEFQGRLLWHLHTPYALAFVATLNEELAGCVLGICHGQSAWFQDLAVHGLCTGEGVGKALTMAMLDAMEEAGCTAQMVLSTDEGEGFWERFGFVPQVELMEYTDIRSTEATEDNVDRLEPEHSMAVLHLDRIATGEDRSTWLREHFYLGQVYLEGARVRGFLLPLLGQGLIVADSPEVGHELQRWLLPVQDLVRLPVGHLQAHAHMVRAQASIRSAGLRMVRGDSPEFRPYMIYAHD